MVSVSTKVAASDRPAGLHEAEELVDGIKVVLGERPDLSLRQRHRHSFGRIKIALAEALVLGIRING